MLFDSNWNVDSERDSANAFTPLIKGRKYLLRLSSELLSNKIELKEKERVGREGRGVVGSLSQWPWQHINSQVRVVGKWSAVPGRLTFGQPYQFWSFGFVKNYNGIFLVI